MRALLRWIALVLLALLALQLFFVARIAAMAVLAPESTSFQRSEAWAQLRQDGGLRWRQQWLPYAQISDHLKRAVVTSEDDNFVNHDGVDWDAIERAWERNARAEALAAKAPATRAPRIRGGSTITQQLAKNLLLSGERNYVRKGQEFVLTLLLEQLLSKRRILEIYLNSVEWGTGIFGAEAAAQHYFKKSARQLTAPEAARLAVMLPAPKRFEKTPNSAYLAGRTRTIVARMGNAELP
ncbi:monofunctional biosynthetic peptidoglycan transglycosylase [Alicycliphilus denitrificans]|uniref:Biosynthetic peptidoglycan transglycosylase n=1 Tax=Alicycliphilus denitrificans (strain DSM 14773 / CIP 107495 / K601) TaxID=596154 RepID=F4GF35_ALIDK|nr:monofunctional biosynthetic peptidoglycan transglycosylase [Alicycliphilus denitrificans]AEB86139.1 Monofunctional biosynthetic peptidoglycan transglycosylase [Alicycliphilus denitrificans K601]GAO21275.1 monofunctional biosynthetic peptidoglycan transglycosylase [Alicycliphilus sp. B1]GAO24952.1 monofunctional biosynthetic peptidoglycan transglycosylase [Alicycliphilus sp. B1]